jgi:hypothetical protein
MLRRLSVTRKWIQGPKGARLDGKYGRTEMKKITSARSKMEQEYETLSEASSEAYEKYLDHWCFKCFFTGTCREKDELRRTFSSMEAKLMRMELFANARR